jgi:single-strand DNA-binding protein
MATVFETRLIGNIGKDASLKQMERGVVAINFPVAHNKNWKDKRTGESRTKTTWVNCTIWKKEGANVRIIDFLKKGALVELLGSPFAKTYKSEDGEVRAEIRLNVSSTNILRASAKGDDEPVYSFVDNESAPCEDIGCEDETMNDQLDSTIENFSLSEDDF